MSVGTDKVLSTETVPSNISYKCYETHETHNLPMHYSYCDHRNFGSLDQPLIYFLHTHCRVTESNSGRGIEIYTTQPGVQLYTANGLDGGLVGKGGIAYPKYGAFCLETQNWPDAIHHVSME